MIQKSTLKKVFVFLYAIIGLTLGFFLIKGNIENNAISEIQKEDLMKYIYQPARKINGEKSPVLLLLHGVGSNEKDLARFAESLDPRFAFYSLRAPLELGAESFAWFHVKFTEEGSIHNVAEAEASRVLLKSFIEDLRKDPQIDPEKIFLLGFSQGTIMGLSLALTEPQLFKGLIAISGRTLQEISAQSKNRMYSQKPEVLLLHGLQDGKLPFAKAVETEATLKAAGFSVDFKSYQAGHEITREMQADIQSWLKSR